MFPYNISNNSVTVVVNGTPKTIYKDDGRFEKVISAIREGRWDDLPNLVDRTKAIHSFSNNRFTIDPSTDTVLFDGEPTPEAFSSKVVKFADENLPCEPLFKFWEKLQNNPSYHSVKQLFGFLDKNDHPITEDGCFIAYKKIGLDWKDLHTKTMLNNIGNIVSMPRNKVDEDPNVTCSAGLHVANWNYANNIYASNTPSRMVSVIVDPADVVAVPNDYDNSKMRVCKYLVLAEIEQEEKATLVKSHCNGCSQCTCLSNEDEDNYSYYDEDEDEDDASDYDY